MRPNPVHPALARLAAAEELALTSEFLAPMVRAGVVQVRIAGVLCRLKVEPSDFEGWGVFRPTSATAACLVRRARLIERRQYLTLLPQLRLIVSRREEDGWLAISAHRGDTRFRIEGQFPVHLIEEPQLFEVVLARFDGARCWWEGPDPRRDPGTAAYLRDSLARMVEPGRLSRTGLTAEERTAYALNHAPRLRAEREARRDRTEERLRAALSHAGATLSGYQDMKDVYRVTYRVDGHRHVSIIDRRDLTVHTAGICLSGEDRRFDLQSLVGVLREGRRGGVD